MIAESLIGKYVIVRSSTAGIFACILKERDGKEAFISNARRLRYWEGSATVSQLAEKGPSHPNKCQFTCEVSEELVTDVSEILLVSEAAKKIIDSVKIWEF